MSKRSSISDQATNPPAAKKSRIDIDDTVAKAEIIITQLLDALKAQKASVQWGHTTCRDDTVASIAKAGLMNDCIKEFGKKSKDVSASVDKLIEALVESEVDALTKASKKYTMADECGDMPETKILEGLQEYNWEIKFGVKKQLKEKFKGLTVDEVIKKVKAETQSVYKAVAKEYCAEAIDKVLS